MKILPKHKDIRVIVTRKVLPYSLGSYISDWFEKISIKQMYLKYDEHYGVWADCCFVIDGNDADSVEPRKWFGYRGRNPKPWCDRPDPFPSTPAPPSIKYSRRQ